MISSSILACPDEQSIVDYVEQRISLEQRRKFDAHIDGCVACQTVVAELATVALSAAPISDRPAGMERTSGSFRGEPDVAGRYEIARCLGAGGMGIVYRAYDRTLRRRVALKFLLDARSPIPPAERSIADRHGRLHREARALARLHHPNIVEVYDIGRIGDDVYVAMEFVEGETLRQWMQRQLPTSQEAVEIMSDAARALAAAHACGVIHRDFKPDNVMITPLGIKVLDFGLARWLLDLDGPTTAPHDPKRVAVGSHDDGPVGTASTRSGTIVGTPAYMAPECLRGEPAGIQADQYAFFVTLYELIHRRRPHRHPRSPGKGDPIEEWGAVPRWLRAAITTGLHSDPARRFPTMNDVVGALRRGPARRRRGPWVAAACVALGAGSYVLFPREQPCAAGLAHLESAWGPRVRSETERALGRTSPSVSAQAMEFADAYAHQWNAAYRRTCEAAHKGELADLAADTSMACLKERLATFRSYTELLRESDRNIAGRLAGMQRILDPPDLCRSDAAAPVDAEARRLQEMAARARMLGAAGRFKEARLLAWRVIDDAGTDRVDANNALASARFAEGISWMADGQWEQAAKSLRLAHQRASAAGRDELAAEAAASLVFIVGVALNRPREADDWVGHAQSAYRRAGRNPDEAVRLLVSRGLVLENNAELDDALSVFQRALPLTQDDSTPRADVHRNLGNALSHLGRFDDAEHHYREAVRIRERLFGAEHTDTLGDRINYAASLLERNMDEQALEQLDRIIDILDRVNASAGHRTTAQSLRGVALRRLGDLPGAIDAQQRALAIAEELYGPAHPFLATDILNLGVAYEAVGDCARALAHAQRARVLLEAGQQADSAMLARAAHNAAAALRCLGRYDRAYDHQVQAATTAFRTAANSPLAFESTYALAGDLERMKRQDEARQALERALAIGEEAGVSRERLDEVVARLDDIASP